MFLAEYKSHKDKFPLQPTMDYQGDSKLANSWEQKSTTKSIMGQNALRYHVEYTKNCDVAINTNYIKSKLNVRADGITRVNELFSPEKSHIYDISYTDLIRQVCSKFTEMKSWRIFLPNPAIICDTRWIFSSTNAMEAPKPHQNLGGFVHVKRTFFGTATSAESFKEYFL